MNTENNANKYILLQKDKQPYLNLYWKKHLSNLATLTTFTASLVSAQQNKSNRDRDNNTPLESEHKVKTI